MDEIASAPPLRVAIVTENFLPKFDGVTRTLARLLEYLQEQGHEALLLGPEGGISEYAGHEVCGTRGIPLYFYPGLSLNFFRPKFMRKLQAFDPDVIHYVDPIWLSAQGQPLIEYALPHCAAVSSYHTNLARYASMYGFDWLVKNIWKLQRRLHGHCLATFCPSLSTRNMLISNGFENVRLWPRGIDTKLFNPARRKNELRKSWGANTDTNNVFLPSKLVITYVGRISNEKNIGLLLEAFRGLSMSAKAIYPAFLGCKLVLVGDGPARKELEASSQNLDIEFAGYREGIELAEYYASSDIFGFPSHSETFGNVVLEAMASGLPVIGLRAEGVCDLVESGTTGFLLDTSTISDTHMTEKAGDIPTDMQKLLIPGTPTFSAAVLKYRQLLLRLCLDAELRRRMSTEAVKYAATRGWTKAMECLVGGYRDAAAETQRRKEAKFLKDLSQKNISLSLASECSDIGIKVEEPPEVEEGATIATTSARLLFGRPPLKGLLQRSTRQAIQKSISMKRKATQATYYELTSVKRPQMYGWHLTLLCLSLGLIWFLKQHLQVDVLSYLVSASHKH